jgi:type II restriction enzyme
MNFEEKLNEFINTLLETNKTYEFYVDWNKININVKENITEINILNSINRISKDKAEKKLREILIKYPECVPVLPAILAERDKKIKIYDIKNKNVKKIDFNEKTFKIDEVMKFVKETGLMNVFREKRNLESYLTGTEVGLDTHARKNRSGKIFENMMEKLIKNKIKNKGEYEYKSQDNKKINKQTKQVDFIIYKNKKPKYAIECNFYNKKGGKQGDMIERFKKLNEEIKKSTEMEFIWVTDGPAWKDMQNTLRIIMENVENVYNYTTFKENINKILKDD